MMSAKEKTNKKQKMTTTTIKPNKQTTTKKNPKQLQKKVREIISAQYWVLALYKYRVHIPVIG